METTTNKITYLKAKHRVDQLKSFYKHLLVYSVINFFIIVIKVLNNLSNGETFEQAFFDWSTFFVAIIWGIFLGMHIFYVVIIPAIFGKNWELNKIESLMKKDLQNQSN